MIWALGQFKHFTGAHPKAIFGDQDDAGQGAVASVYPGVPYIYDDYHLNKNQKSRTARNSSMATELHRLRRSPTKESYEIRLDEFIQQWFTDENQGTGTTSTIPMCFASLSINNRESVALYARPVPLFTINGSGYSESSFAIYRRLIMETRCPVFEIPAELERWSQRNDCKASKDLANVQQSNVRLLQGAGFPKTEATKVCSTITNYAARKFAFNSVAEAARWDVETAAKDDKLAIHATLVNSQGNQRASISLVDSSGETSIQCLSCMNEVLDGMPCQHSTKAMFRLERILCLANLEGHSLSPVNLLSHFPSFWLRDQTQWKLHDRLKLTHGRQSLSIVGDQGDANLPKLSQKQRAASEKIRIMYRLKALTSRRLDDLERMGAEALIDLEASVEEALKCHGPEPEIMRVSDPPHRRRTNTPGPRKRGYEEPTDRKSRLARAKRNRVNRGGDLTK